MTSTVVAIGQNQVYSFSPALDLLDERTTGRLDTHLNAATKKQSSTQVNATPAIAPASAASNSRSLDALMARFSLKKSSGVAVGATAVPTAAASASASSDSSAAASQSPLNLLFFESSDILHALKTMIHQHRHQKKGGEKMMRPLNLYHLDSSPHSTARSLLLLAISLDTSFSLRGRTELFLEVYGNTLVQEKTQMYINRKVKEIRKFIQTQSTLTSIAPPTPLSSSSDPLFRGLVDLSQLRYKDLDDVETQLDFFVTQEVKKKEKQKKDTTSEEGEEEKSEQTENQPQSTDTLKRVLPQKDPHSFDIEQLRDHRLRGYFGERYDARANLIDWDYHMRLKGVASIIHPVHYKKWRMSGLAFEERLCTYTLPNRTFSSYREAKSKERGNTSVRVRGYWADTLVSPYISLGVEADEKRMFERRNKQHVKTSPHVCEYNLLAMLYELETGSVYSIPQEKTKVVVGKKAKERGTKEGEKKEDEGDIVELPDEVPLAMVSASPASTSSSSSSATPTTLCYSSPTALSLSHVKMIFLNGSAKTLANQTRYHSHFDRIYLSQFEVGSINEHEAAQVAKEAKKLQQDQKQKQNSTPDSSAKIVLEEEEEKVNENDTFSTPIAPTQETPPVPVNELPLNKLLKNNAVVTVETVKFLPVTSDIKSAYVSQVQSLASSAGWKPASVPGTAWSADAQYNSWSEREVEQQNEEEEKKDAETQPARLNFVWKEQ